MVRKSSANSKNPAPAAAHQLPLVEGQDVCSWSDVDGTVLRSFVHAFSLMGWAVTLGMTSQGRALAVTLLMDDERLHHYFDSSAKCTVNLRVWAEWATDLFLART